MSTTLTIADGPKMLREALCVAEHAVNRNIEPQNQHGAPRILAALIAECDRHRPLGPDGKHGDRHTDTCGCDDMPLDPSKVKAGDTVALDSDELVANVTGRVTDIQHDHGAWTIYLTLGVMGHSTPFVVGVGTSWRLVAHDQPAPEPEPEWKPGTVGTAGTVRGLTYTGPVVRADNPVMPWWTPAYIGGAHWHREADVTDFVPDEPRAVWSRQGLRAALVHSDSLKTDPGTGMTYIDPDLATERLAAYMRGESR